MGHQPQSRSDGATTERFYWDNAGRLSRRTRGPDTWLYLYDGLSKLRAVQRNGAFVLALERDVQGAVGNVRDLCGDLWTLSGPEDPEGIVRIALATAAEPGYRVVRGGCYHARANAVRAASRMVAGPEEVWSSLGFRLARSL